MRMTGMIVSALRAKTETPRPSMSAAKPTNAPAAYTTRKYCLDIGNNSKVDQIFKEYDRSENQDKQEYSAGPARRRRIVAEHG